MWALETHVLLSFFCGQFSLNGLYQRYQSGIEISSTKNTRPIGYFTKVSIMFFA